MKKYNFNVLMAINVALLGLLMLVSGLIKLFVSGASGVSGMLSKNVLFSWAPMFWAVVLIIMEIGSGLTILARWKIKYTAYIPVIILGIAVLTMTIKWNSIAQTSWTSLIFHLLAITNYLILAASER